MAYYGNTASLLSTVAENKFPYFLNTVLALRINSCVIKKSVAESFVQYDLSFHACVVKFDAVPQSLDFQKVKLTDGEKVGGFFEASRVYGFR